MKIIHTSDICLGKKFSGFNTSGDKLRAGLKSALSRIIDHTIKVKADALIIAGNLFDNTEISINLRDYIASELGRLNHIPAIILPGIKDKYADGAFWKIWQNSIEYKNIHILTPTQNPFVVLEDLGLAVYGIFPPGQEKNKPKLARQKTIYHVGVACSTMDLTRALIDKAGIKFDYVALGGELSFVDLSLAGVMAAFSGAPENLGFERNGSGYIVETIIDAQKNLQIDRVQIGEFNWMAIEIDAREIVNNDDLIIRIKSITGPDPAKTALRINLTGLALFEATLSPQLIEDNLHDEFLYLNITDNMKVLPENVSEVKVSEKALLGQYLKVLAGEIASADEGHKKQLEKSAKVGLALLQGREIW